MLLFVTDKGFLHVIPMKRKQIVLKAVNQFAKEISAQDAITCDAAREQTSTELKAFCNDMGTALQVIDENTYWTNKAELYIGMIKEAVCNDMKQDMTATCFLTL